MYEKNSVHECCQLETNSERNFLVCYGVFSDVIDLASCKAQLLESFRGIVKVTLARRAGIDLAEGKIFGRRKPMTNIDGITEGDERK